MNDNPFLTVLKIAFTAILAFGVFLAFAQRTHLEDQIARLDQKHSSLQERISEMSRRVDAAKEGNDRLVGATEQLVEILKSGTVSVGTPRTTVGTATPSVAGYVLPKDKWGWDYNERIDSNLDASRPVGTAGRYKNFISLDPDPEVPADAKEGGTLASPYGDDPKGFNFLTENDSALTEQLKIYVAGAPASPHWANPYRYGPDLCWRVEVSPDYREYVLFFRRDAIWHEPPVDLSKYPHLRGRHSVTARDYKFTLDAIRNPQTDCAPLRGYYDDIESVEAPDDWTCVIRWKKTLWHSIAFGLGRETMPEFVFGFSESGDRFPPETFGQQFNEHWLNKIGVCGCGPYRFVSYEPGKWITMERFDDWHGARGPHGVKYPVQKKRALIYSDPETTYLKIQSGELDITGLTAPQYRKSFLANDDPNSPFKDGRIGQYKYQRSSYFYIGWKNTDPLFSDPKVRKALALACNRFDIAEKIFLGRLVPMAAPVFPGSPQSDPALKPLPFDLAEAARLFDEAGWKRNDETGVREKQVGGATRRFQFKVMWPSPSPEYEGLLNHYKNDLQTIGVILISDPVEWTIWQKKAHDREFQALSAGWSTDAWDHDFDQIWHSRQIKEPGSSNYIEYSNPELDALSDSLRAEMDTDKRVEKVRRIGQILHEEQPTCFLGWVQVYGAKRARVQNVPGRIYKSRPNLRTFPMWVNDR
jgi:peptide/nickel transport system substrate-binding protein